MATEFVSWATELARFKNAVANKDVDAFWVASSESSNRQMRVTYTKLGNVTKFLEWLQMMADSEALTEAEGGSGAGSSGILFSVGGE